MPVDMGGYHIASPSEVAEEPCVYLLPSNEYGYFAADTTAAAHWLLENVKKGDTVVDVGTGTGILAILAAKCGGLVTAYEMSSEARKLAKKHFELNRVKVDLRDSFDGKGRWDWAVVNLGARDAALIEDKYRHCFKNLWVTPDA